MSEATGSPGSPTHSSARLGWILVFAVVYADIGTSIFYVPGILYLSIGNLATIAQIITTAVFVSIALKYVEICERCPDGGGVVSVCREAFSSWMFLPLLGGSFITVDYFLTSAISGVSGLYYLASLAPATKQFVLPACFLLFCALTALNIVGLKESAFLIAWLAAIEIVVVAILIVVSGIYLTTNGMWSQVFGSILHPGHGKELTTESLMIGYATTWLAYSGLESASQISGAMAPPLKVTASRAMWLVIGIVAVFSPCITAATISILPEHVMLADPESLLSALAHTIGGAQFGGVLQVLTVIAAAALLFMACNTAIVGNYHVNVRLADLGFCPAILRKRHAKFGTPWISVVVSAAIPMIVLLATRGSISALGDLYAFGLLGTLTLSSVSIDKLRWRDGNRSFNFWWGVFTSVALAIAWLINIFHKPYALVFGGIIAGIMVVTGLKHRDQIEDKVDEEFERVEAAAADTEEAASILTLEEAVDAKDIEGSTVLISLRYVNAKLLDECAWHVRGQKKQNAYVIYVDEAPSLFLPPGTKPTENARRVLDEACAALRQRGVAGIPIWRIAEDAGHAIAESAMELGVKTVYVGASKRTFFWRMLRGRILKRLADTLPEACTLVVVG